MGVTCFGRHLQCLFICFFLCPLNDWPSTLFQYNLFHEIDFFTNKIKEKIEKTIKILGKGKRDIKINAKIKREKKKTTHK